MSYKFLKIIIILLPLIPGFVFSQELDPIVDVNMDRLSPDIRDRLSSFKQDVTDYLSRTKFSDEVIVNDVRGKPYKIRCAFNIAFNSATGFDSYDAQLVVTTQRNIYRTPNYTSLLRIKDDKWQFSYTRGETMYHDNLKFNALTSLLDYYAYMIIGIDDDSWELELGTKRFQLALDAVNLAAANSSSSGWADNVGLTASRVTYPQELLNSKYDDFRKGFWLYHFSGIDSLQYDKRHALERIAQAIELIGKTKKAEVKSFTIKAFFDAKYLEIATALIDYYDKTIYRRLGEIDPDHVATYDEYSKK
jgi:Domain of unknown function (DUF4835)